MYPIKRPSLEEDLQVSLRKRLQPELAKLLSGQRKQLAHDQEIIAAFRAGPVLENIAAFNDRCANRYASLVSCLADIVLFVDDFLVRFREDLSARKQLNNLQRDYTALQKERDSMQRTLKRQAEELKHLQELSASRKKVVNRLSVVSHHLRDQVQLLQKKERIRKYLQEKEGSNHGKVSR